MVMEAVMAPYKGVLEDKQKVAKQSKVTHLFTKFSVSPASFTPHQTP
jgi:hypothetical protein